MRLLDQLLKSVRSAATFNPEIQVAPACILWPDRERQWEAVIPLIQTELPELLILGDYDPEKRTGPAIWLRCAIAGQTDDVALPRDQTPIVYLPGVSRQDLRAVESCPAHLKPLAELQYRGAIWSQINAKDWTVLAYLKSDQGGLGLDVAQDKDAKNAMQLALYRLLDEEISLLKGKRLDKDYFNTLLTGGDPSRDLLQWLDQGDAFQAGRGQNEWNAFVEVCQSQLAFNPENEGVLAGCMKLANHEGPWLPVWERYCEAPRRYPHIPARIKKCSPPSDTMLWYAGGVSFDGWPQWNESQEHSLCRDLLALANVPAHEARAKIKGLEKQHGCRRATVWAELGEAPLACALEHLALIADFTQHSLAAGSLDDITAGYCGQGWRVDDAAIRALAYVTGSEVLAAVKTALQSVYLPWLEESARYLQKLVDGATYPGGGCLTTKTVPYCQGDCILFVDGLRYDVAKRLVHSVEEYGLKISEEPAWAALPSVTATGKAAVCPVRDKIRGKDDSPDFEPSVAEGGQSLKGGYHLKKLLTDAGWSILDRSADGDGQGMAWCEFGNIDHEGHGRGWKLARYLDDLIHEIAERIMELLAAGWKRVRVVTDHGWLLLPEALPKIDLPSVLVENKWGRCASLKPKAHSEERLYPWYWNPSQYFALANGVNCFKKGEEYAHGGLSLQECLTLQLTVTRNDSAQDVPDAQLTNVEWKGLRCTVATNGNCAGLFLDVRGHAGNPETSVVKRKLLKDDGTASVVVENEDWEGHDAMVVLVDANGALVAQFPTVIGGDTK
ncbi:MAG: BREX-1 system phosphatase PglZ type B [Desulfovibrionaceae bacterium]|nr:BREX-1 system phosphatase PglZ type B [Desulfovibrionaceae bacterium]